MENTNLLKRMDRVAIGLSIFVLIAVVLLRYLPPFSPENLPFDVHALSGLNALFNSLTAVTLILAIVFIKQKNVQMHQRFIYAAMTLSALFLVSYVAYHFMTEPTLFGDLDKNGLVSDEEKSEVGGIRIVYLVLLLTHVVLAAVILPFILFTFNRGFTSSIEKHRKIARITFPIWLYVAITGVICYFMIHPYH